MSKQDIWGRNGRTVTVFSKQEPPIQNKRVQKYDPAFLHLQHTKQFVLRPHLASSRHDLAATEMFIHMGKSSSCSILLWSGRSWSRFRVWHQLLVCKIERHTCCNSPFSVGGQLSRDLPFFAKSQWRAPLTEAVEPVRL